MRFVLSDVSWGVCVCLVSVKTLSGISPTRRLLETEWSKRKKDFRKTMTSVYH